MYLAIFSMYFVYVLKFLPIIIVSIGSITNATRHSERHIMYLLNNAIIFS